MHFIELYNQQLSLLGALFILIAYMGHQFKWRYLQAKYPFYHLLNIFGAAILCVVAIKPFVAGFFVLELIWVLVSITAWIRTNN